MNDPDYATYTLAQLKDAFRRIDRESYPERFAKLEKELKSRPNETPPVEYGSRMSRTLRVPIEAFGVFRKFESTVRGCALALALNNMFGELAGRRITFLALDIRVNSPWSPGPLVHGIAIAIYWILLVLLVVGGLSLWTKARWMHWTLPLVWGLLGLRIRIGTWSWWPMFYEPLNISFTYSSSAGGEIGSVVQIVGVPLTLAVISLVTLPDSGVDGTH